MNLRSAHPHLAPIIALLSASLLIVLFSQVYSRTAVAEDDSPEITPSPSAETFTETIEITPDLPICCFDGNLPASRRLMARDPRDQQIIAMVTNILKYAGLAPNFRIVEVDENNAFAMVHNGERILGFGPEYLRSISSASGTDWARLGVMAHEIGHHVQGHVLKKDETVEQAHREELEADEYAGFICGMMGSTERASYSHTALMANFDSDSHPAKSRRIEATKRGWLKAQHIRRTVNKEGSCPIVEVTGPGFETRSYMGTIGRHDAIVNLTRSPDRTVFGTYDLTVNGSTQQYRFTGRSNEAVNKITLEEYFGCEPSATIHLSKALAGRTERWEGTMHNQNGSELQVEMMRSLPPSPQSKPTTSSSSPTNPRERFYLTTMAGFPQKWLPVFSKNTPFTDQKVYHSEEFPHDWIRPLFSKGYRITSVAGDRNGWSVVMSLGSSYTAQYAMGPGEINETQYAKLRDDGYRITSLAGFEDSWVMILSKGASLGNQRFTKIGKFRPDWIRARWDEGYRITQMAGDDNETGGSWMVVMSQGSGLSAQAYSSGNGFPTDWIVQFWNKGYHITSLSGYDNWRVVMSKDSGYAKQSYLPASSNFPEEYIASKMGQGHSVEESGALPEGTYEMTTWDPVEEEATTIAE